MDILDEPLDAPRRRRTTRAVEVEERPALRPPMRDEDPRARAARREAEILGNGDDAFVEDTDEFYIPESMKPDGWSYEWKRKLVYGAEDPAYQVALARTGWTPVPTGRHPEMMPVGWKGETIERKGMMLMERPLSITERVEAQNRRRASNQVRAKEQQLNSAPPGTMEREYSDPRTRPTIKKSFEAMPVPKD
mgnify:CR=1 FL=1